MWDPAAVAGALGAPPPPAVLPAIPPAPGEPPGEGGPFDAVPGDKWDLADLLAFHGSGGFDD